MFSSFKGGIHPPENKEITAGMAFRSISVPHRCCIPMLQHIGAPARALVAPGDIVEEGQLIAEAQGFISANVHSSVPGKVVEIVRVNTVYGLQNSIVIETDGAFQASSVKASLTDWKTLSPAEITGLVKDAGIVGLGGAAFPSSVKLSPPKEKKIDTLIVNGAECEPYITVDDMLMRTYPEDIIEGIRIILHALSIKTAIIGIEDNKKEAAAILRKALAANPPPEKITVKTLRTRYPQGAEKQLIYSLIGRKVPHGELPMDVGAVVHNVGTVFAVKEAVTAGKPLFERFVTVSGSMINKPGNYRVRIGTTLQDIIDDCGGLKGDPERIVIGGPMCGTAVYSTDVPVVKGTSAILFLAANEIDAAEYGPCLRCGNCVDVCPIRLLPCDIAAAVERNRPDIAEKYKPFDCILCGSCTFVCPAKRPVSHFVKLARKIIKK